MGGTHRFVAPRCTPLAVNVSSLVSVPRPLPLPRGYSACCSASRVLARNGFCVLLARGLALCVLYPSHSSRGISGCVLCPPVPVCGVGCGLSPVYLPGRVGIRVSRYNVPNFQLRAGSGFCGPLGPCGDLRALRAPLRALYCFIWWLLCWLSLLGCGYRWGAGEVPSRYQAWRTGVRGATGFTHAAGNRPSEAVQRRAARRERQDGRGGCDRAVDHVGVLHAQPGRQHAPVRAAERDDGGRAGVQVGLHLSDQHRVVRECLRACAGESACRRW